MLRNFATDAFKTASITIIQKAAEATGDLIGNKIADRIKNVSKTSTQNNSVTNEEENIVLDRFVLEIIEDLRLI